MSLSDEQINSESWRLSTKRQYENWTGCEYHVVEGIQDFARVIESEVAAPLLERIADLERELEAVRKDAERMDWIAIHGSFGVDSVTGQIGGNGQKRIAATRTAIDAAKEKQ
jgi:hypothetical protein